MKRLLYIIFAPIAIIAFALGSALTQVLWKLIHLCFYNIDSILNMIELFFNTFEREGYACEATYLRTIKELKK